jgi:hypothetical protein
MTTLDQMMDSTTELPKVSRRRIPGLRMPALPSWPLLAQAGGGAGVLVAVHGWWGWTATIMVASVAAIVLGTLREAGKV